MLLRSTSRTEILRALACQPGPVGLRQVARIAGVHPHAAELSLATLVQECLVKRRGTSNSFQSLLFTASTARNNQFNQGCALNCYAPMPFAERVPGETGAREHRDETDEGRLEEEASLIARLAARKIVVQWPGCVTASFRRNRISPRWPSTGP